MGQQHRIPGMEDSGWGQSSLFRPGKRPPGGIGCWVQRPRRLRSADGSGPSPNSANPNFQELAMDNLNVAPLGGLLCSRLGPGLLPGDPPYTGDQISSFCSWGWMGKRSYHRRAGGDRVVGFHCFFNPDRQIMAVTVNGNSVNGRQTSPWHPPILSHLQAHGWIADSSWMDYRKRSTYPFPHPKDPYLESSHSAIGVGAR